MTAFPFDLKGLIVTSGINATVGDLKIAIASKATNKFITDAQIIFSKVPTIRSSLGVHVIPSGDVKTPWLEIDVSPTAAKSSKVGDQAISNKLISLDVYGLIVFLIPSQNIFEML